MIFNEILESNLYDNKKQVLYREAVRAIILKNNMLLMILSNKGTYKLPGGGMNKNELREVALRREVLEETGFFVENIIARIGLVVERKPDLYDSEVNFEMVFQLLFVRSINN